MIKSQHIINIKNIQMKNNTDLAFYHYNNNTYKITYKKGTPRTRDTKYTWFTQYMGYIHKVVDLLWDLDYNSNLTILSTHTSHSMMESWVDTQKFILQYLLHLVIYLEVWEELHPIMNVG